MLTRHQTAEGRVMIPLHQLSDAVNQETEGIRPVKSMALVTIIRLDAI